MAIVRYADDIVVGFWHDADARRFQEAMRERLAAFTVALHPDKTRLIASGRFAARDRQRQGTGKPETVAVLGFTSSAPRAARAASSFAGRAVATA